MSRELHCSHSTLNVRKKSGIVKVVHFLHFRMQDSLEILTPSERTRKEIQSSISSLVRIRTYNCKIFWSSNSSLYHMSHTLPHVHSQNSFLSIKRKNSRVIISDILNPNASFQAEYQKGHCDSRANTRLTDVTECSKIQSARTIKFESSYDSQQY